MEVHKLLLSASIATLRPWIVRASISLLSKGITLSRRRIIDDIDSWSHWGDRCTASCTLRCIANDGSLWHHAARRARRAAHLEQRSFSPCRTDGIRQFVEEDDCRTDDDGRGISGTLSQQQVTRELDAEYGCWITCRSGLARSLCRNSS